jgi:hypothetical protein
MTATAPRPPSPSATSTTRSEPVFRWFDLPIFVVLSCVQLVAVALAAQAWLRAGSVLPSLMLVALAGPPIIGFVMYLGRWFTLPLMRRPVPVAPAAGLRVGVATTFVEGLEPLEMLEETVAALVAMEYPHDTWVLDEGNSDEVRALCARLGARHFSRRGIDRYQQAEGTFEARTKHGNYNAWLDAEGYDRYDVIVNVDPDHIPVPEFLDRLLGYFRDPDIGYVQAAQAYYNQRAGFIARGAAQETYSYYSTVQMASYTLGYPIVTGCHTAHRTRALREVGGFAAHEADDLLITVLYRATGWRGVYVPEVLAEGLVPVDWPAYTKQQRRWARSVLDVKLREFPKVAGQLPLVERVTSAIHGIYYLHGLATGLAVVTLAALLVARGGSFPLTSSLSARTGVAVACLALCDLYRQRFFLRFGDEWGVHLSAGIVRFAKWPFMFIALGDALSGRRLGYTTTPKVRVSGRRLAVAPPHLAAAAIVAAAWGVSLALGRTGFGVIELFASVFLVASVAVAATDLLPRPEAYERRLSARRLTARDRGTDAVIDLTAIEDGRAGQPSRRTDASSSRAPEPTR